MPTLRQERLAEALADPTNKTKRQALLAAGYSPTTANRNPGQAIVSIGTQRAKADLEASRLDSARKIARKAGTSVLERLDTMQDGPLILAWKTAEELKQGEPEEETRFSPPGLVRHRARRKAMAHRRAAMRWVLSILDAGGVDALRAALEPPGVPPIENAP